MSPARLPARGLAAGGLRAPVYPLNPAYSSLDGVLLNKDQTALIRHPQVKAGAYTIPDGVTSTGSGAFSGCTSLSSVTIPDGVTTIGHLAFYNCSGLTSVTIGNGVSSIGQRVFERCTSLTSVVIGDSVTSIGLWTFHNCTSLISVYFQGRRPSLGEHVFDEANKVRVFYLPSTPGWGSSFGGRPPRRAPPAGRAPTPTRPSHHPQVPRTCPGGPEPRPVWADRRS
jgi:hypothetical protein